MVTKIIVLLLDLLHNVIHFESILITLLFYEMQPYLKFYFVVILFVGYLDGRIMEGRKETVERERISHL